MNDEGPHGGGELAARVRSAERVRRRRDDIVHSRSNAREVYAAITIARAVRRSRRARSKRVFEGAGDASAVRKREYSGVLKKSVQHPQRSQVHVRKSDDELDRNGHRS